MEIKEKIQELEKQIEKLKKEVQKEEGMEEWFKSLLNGLEIRIYNNEPDSVFYKKNGEIFFELHQYPDKTHFICDYDLVWSVFEKKYKLNDDEIEEFIKSMVEQHLKLSEVTPIYLAGKIY
jgi:thioredoxin-related protein